MPNQPASGTVTVSFTLPRVLADSVNRLAKRQLTNKSELIRRALMEYLPADVRAGIEAAIDADEVSVEAPSQGQAQGQESGAHHIAAGKTKKERNCQERKELTKMESMTLAEKARGAGGEDGGRSTGFRKAPQGGA